MNTYKYLFLDKEVLIVRKLVKRKNILNNNLILHYKMPAMQRQTVVVHNKISIRILQTLNLNATYVMTLLMNQLWHSVVICIVGFAYINGWINPKKLCSVLCAKVALVRKESYPYIQKEETLRIQGKHYMKSIYNGIGIKMHNKMKVSLDVQLVRDMDQYQIKITTGVAGSSAITDRMEGLWWDLDFFLLCLP